MIECRYDWFLLSSPRFKAFFSSQRQLEIDREQVAPLFVHASVNSIFETYLLVCLISLDLLLHSHLHLHLSLSISCRHSLGRRLEPCWTLTTTMTTTKRVAVKTMVRLGRCVMIIILLLMGLTSFLTLILFSLVPTFLDVSGEQQAMEWHEELQSSIR